VKKFIKFPILFGCIALSNCQQNARSIITHPPVKTPMKINFQFKGKIVVIEKNTPWGKETAIVEDQDGNIHYTELPIKDSIMELIINHSNYLPNTEMAEQVANIFFQTVVTPSPDGNAFLHRVKDEQVTLVYRVVDRNGVLWELTIKSDGKKNEFSSKRTNIFYNNLVRF
jgi:hypothetical protein